MEEKQASRLYRVIYRIVKLIFPKFQVVGAENLPQASCVIVGNHSQLYGPLAGEFYIPGKHEIWCAGQMLHRKEVADYAYQDFWSGKPRWNRWLYWLLSRMIGPLAELIFTNAHTIPVYHDIRIVSTFRDSMKKLDQGSNIVIFPEQYKEHNNIVHEFHEKFVDLAHIYFMKTGEVLSFVPLYLAPRLKTMYFGAPIVFNPKAPIAEERKRICGALMDTITDIAVALPEHTVVPYPNIPKKRYPKNSPLELRSNEEKAS